MIQLHYYPSTASMAPHILLRELGVPFELLLVDRTQNAQKMTAYLKLNPNGLIPVLANNDEEGELVLYEAAAICLHLCDTYPAAGLAPRVGTAARAHFYKWLMWLTNTLQATLITYFYPERWVNVGNDAGAAQVKAQAEIKVGVLLDQLDAELARQALLHPEPWLLGASYSVVDIYALMLCRWTRNFASNPARDRTHLGPYLQRVLARPAVFQAFEAEELAQPWV
ncbi:MAG: glutathione S-transferase family protein [Chitinophagaceae bacterium]|nr:glutathione S-transferase family protein [Polaromonas sp.]